MLVLNCLIDVTVATMRLLVLLPALLGVASAAPTSSQSDVTGLMQVSPGESTHSDSLYLHA
jgi:hypothetical protein